MAWVKGLSRKEQLSKMRGVAEARVSVAAAMLDHGFEPRLVRKVLREEAGVSAMTAYRDVRVAMGGERSEKRSRDILRGRPQEPLQAVFSAAVDLQQRDLEAIAWELPQAVLLATSQLSAGSGVAFKALLSDEEARIALTQHWAERRSSRDVLSNVSAFQTKSTKKGRGEAIRAMEKYVSARGRIDSTWRK
jgi:hypothetical protein